MGVLGNWTSLQERCDRVEGEGRREKGCVGVLGDWISLQERCDRVDGGGGRRDVWVCLCCPESDQTSRCEAYYVC